MRGFGFLFLSVSLCLFCSQGAFGQAHTVAITVDDLPFASDALSAAETAHISEIPNRQLLNAFQVHHAPVTGFVIQKRVESRALRPASRYSRSGLSSGNDALQRQLHFDLCPYCGWRHAQLATFPPQLNRFDGAPG